MKRVLILVLLSFFLSAGYTENIVILNKKNVVKSVQFLKEDKSSIQMTNSKFFFEYYLKLNANNKFKEQELHNMDLEQSHESFKQYYKEIPRRLCLYFSLHKIRYL